jgi:hypothetical protein
MTAVAVVALAFGGCRQVNRLKQKRDRCLARATWHAGAETYYRGLIASVATRLSSRKEADESPMSPTVTSIELDRVIEQWFGLPAERSIQIEGDDRFREARARSHALAANRRKILDDYTRRQAECHQKRADYHAALARKYAIAASRPWLPVEPDPPPPK